MPPFLFLYFLSFNFVWEKIWIRSSVRREAETAAGVWETVTVAFVTVVEITVTNLEPSIRWRTAQIVRHAFLGL